jgi:hypothetical protein
VVDAEGVSGPPDGTADVAPSQQRVRVVINAISRAFTW